MELGSNNINTVMLGSNQVTDIYLGGTQVLKEFTPEDLTTSLWLDASDEDTITESSGSVSQWNDKSGNDNHAVQTESSKQPSFANSQITFDGTNDCMKVTDNAGLDLTEELTIFVVANPTVTATTSYLICRNGSSYAEIQYTLDYSNSSNLSNIVLNGTVRDNSPVGSFATGQLNIISATYNKIVAEVFGNGESNGSSSYTASLTSRGNMFVGCRSNSSTGSTQSALFEGEINEIIIIPTSLSEEDRQKIEGYLAHKWGLEDNLPSDHPYKTNKPTI